MKTSAGLLLYRHSATTTPSGATLEVLLAHIGGPLWEHRDAGAWTIPKGELDDGEAAYAAALREFAEEIGSAPPISDAPDIPLGRFRQNTRKDIVVWARQADFDAAAAQSNLFEMEWPVRSGQFAWFPEVDRAEWFAIDVAQQRIVQGQRQVLARLRTVVGEGAVGRGADVDPGAAGPTP